MNRFLWLYNRLKAMTPQEVFYRINKTSKHKTDKIKYRKNLLAYQLVDDNIDLKKVYKNLNNIFHKIDYSSVEIKDYFHTFNDKVEFCNKYQWHNGTEGMWNSNQYSYDIEFKNTDTVGDIRYTWEINRHQFMPYLASIYIKTKDEKYLDLLKNSFEDWMGNNYFLKGVNWSSPMEIALRAYQWLIVLYLLEDVDDFRFKEILSKSIIVSIEYVTKNLSLYSSANNHLILEVMISSTIGYAFKDSYDQNWFNEGYKILKKEIILQNHEDGVNKEQALHYQAFILDAIIQYNFILKNIGEKPIEEKLIYNALGFIGSFKADKLNFDYGDSDDAKILSFSYKKNNYYQHILELGSIYYKEKFIEFYTISNEVKFISGISDMEAFKKVKYKKSKLYKNGGYLVINNDKDNLLMDVGELGFGAIAAHGHADALSFIYYNNDNPIIIDSGTYIYNIESEKRNYFRSTDAHSTLCYNGINQSEIRGPFLWGKKANTTVLEYTEKGDLVKIKACHDGYKPLIHTRELEYYFDRKIIIRDYFDDKAKVNYILDNKSKTEMISANIVRIKSNDSIILFKSNSSITIEDTLISKSFMTKTKSKKIVIEKDFSNNKYLEVVIEEENKNIM